MNNILITGGSGFLGHNVILTLRAAGYSVKCLDRYEADFLRENNVEFLSGDISEKNLIEQSLKDVDIVIHMACTILPQMSNSDPYFDMMTNVGGTLNLLDAAVKNNVKKVVFLSSGGTVYGCPQFTPITEEHPTNPTCSYGISKLMVEKYLRLYRELYGLASCAVRLANPYGRFQRVKSAQGVIPVFCYKALKGEEIQIWGDGNVRRDFIYVDDVAEAILRVLKTEGLPPELNIGSGIATSLNELLKEITVICNKKLKVKYMEKRGFDVPVSVLNISKAETVLGWHPVICLRDGLKKTISWINQNCL